MPRSLQNRAFPHHKLETVYHPIRVPKSIQPLFMARAGHHRSINAYVNALIEKDIAGTTSVTDCRNCMHLQFFESLAEHIANMKSDPPPRQCDFDFVK